MRLYLEPTESGQVWWSESPQVPGFHATGVDMQDLILRSELFLSEILEDDVELRCRLVGQPPNTEETLSPLARSS